jgi:acetyl coenzyme A synthetase (ADP forming)-like protein
MDPDNHPMTSRFLMHRNNLEKIFYPRSVAVVGTNNIKGTVPYDILFNILKAEFKGVLFPVSPGEKSICSVKAFKYVIDIEDEVDLAILVFPAQVCHLAMEQCGQKGIKAAVIISAGFKETGEKGREREMLLKQIAERYDMSFIGPNCLGIINTDPAVNLNASFARKMPEEGTIGFLSQSGALCTAVLDYARAKHIGFSKFISFGNKADISEIDLLYYLKDDEKTKVILLYLEEVSDGQALMKAAQDIIIESGKPVLILKSGRTVAGASAAASHTGSLAGSDEICNAAFIQAGIIRCSNIEEMFNIAIAFAYQPLPKTNKIAIITNAGGPGVLTTDAAIHEGLELASLQSETTRILKKYLPSTANTNNPVDVIGDARADRYNLAITAAMNDPGVDGIFVILTPQSMTDIDTIAHEIVKVTSGYTKPIYASFMGEADVRSGVDILQRNKIPHYILPESMCRSFARVCRFAADRHERNSSAKVFSDVNKEAAKAIIQEALHQHMAFLTEEKATKILEAYRFPVLQGSIADTPAKAARMAAKIGFPVVMKILSHEIIHKSDVQGVILGIANESEAEKAFRSIMDSVSVTRPGARIEGVYIARMIETGLEVILGIKRDPSFGPVIMFGLGGIFVELYKDVSLSIAPVSETAAEKMVHDIKAYGLLDGMRGTGKYDKASIISCILRLSQLSIDFPQIEELDINPLIVLREGHGAYVADAKIVLQHTSNY